jgi:Na+/proline symporter
MVAPVDIGLIALYLLAVAFIGYRSSRKESKKDYLIASKNLGVWDNIATLSATKITASIIITFVALVYLFGISTLWAYVGTGIGYILFLYFALKIKREGDKYNYNSMSDYFFHHYGTVTGKIVSFIIFLTIFINFTVQLIGGATIIKALTGLAFIWGVLLCGIVVLFYLYLGGFKAVVKTDVVQFVAIVVLFFILGVFLFSNFTFESSHWNPLSGGAKFIIPMLLVGILFPFSAPDLWQRAIAAKDTRSLKKSFIITTILYLLFGFLLGIIALTIRLKLPAANPDTALVQGFALMLPPGLLGFGLVALFAAIMSSADSYAFISSEVLMHSLIGRKKTLSSLKHGILGIMLAGMIFAILFQSIIKASFLLVGLFMVMSVAVIATWIKPNIKKITLNTTIIFGIISTLAMIPFIGFTAMMVVIGIGSGLLGLIIGAILSIVF